MYLHIFMRLPHVALPGLFLFGKMWTQGSFSVISMVNTQELEVLLEECAARHGAHLIDLVLRGRQHKPVIEVFIDSEAGVTTELCSEVSREVARALIVQPIVTASYDLIVSSPGIERPIKFTWQYQKHIGRVFHVRVQGETGVIEHTGKLVAMDDKGITLETGKNGDRTAVVFEMIMDARVKAPW